jgi:hypothetical protein
MCHPLPPKYTHPREGGGLVRREAAFICAADAACRIPAFAGMVLNYYLLLPKPLLDQLKRGAHAECFAAFGTAGL